MTTLTLEEAKRTLPALAQRALLGEQVMIRVEGNQMLLLLHRIEPELPENYLAHCYGADELAEEQYLDGFAPTGAST
jgi:hypothetical protein